jgi:putative spermidine/putrescine transport system substrate-binding protein
MRNRDRIGVRPRVGGAVIISGCVLLTSLGYGSTALAATGHKLAKIPKAGTTLVFEDSGGLLLQEEMQVFIKPFEEATGINVEVESPVNFPAVQTQVAAHHVSVDLVEFSSEYAQEYCGSVLQNIDKYFDMSQYYANYIVSKCGVPESTFVHEFFYDKKDFPTNPPTTWADFFNATKYPGQRAVWNSGDGTNYEQALLGAGVSAKHLYPLNYTLAFKEWDKIKSSLVYWNTAAEAIQMMQSQSAPIIDAWGPFATEAVINGASNYVAEPANPIFLNNQFMIPKGAPDLGAALEFIRFATTTARQLALVESYPEGPTNKAVQPKTFANVILKRYYVGKYITKSVTTNVAWRASHFPQMEAKWVAWASG